MSPGFILISLFRFLLNCKLEFNFYFVLVPVLVREGGQIKMDILMQPKMVN